MIELYHGDCADLASLFSECDVQISDLPYRAWVHAKATSQSAKGGTRLRDLGFKSITGGLLDVAAHAASKVKRWSLIYSDVESTGNVREACLTAESKYVRIMPWIRWSMPQLTGTMPTQGWEAINVFHSDSRKNWNGQGNCLCLEQDEEGYDPDETVPIRHKALRGEDKHKTEKPLDQMLDLVSWFSNPGETVLDLTAGRGTTAVACVLLGRSFLGAELDEERTGEHARALARVQAAERGELSKRDSERVTRYCEAVAAEDVSKFTEPSQARYANRFRDAQSAVRWLG
jgi:hypothetical protein